MEDHVNVTMATERTCKSKTSRVADARRQIFSGATAGIYVIISVTTGFKIDHR